MFSNGQLVQASDLNNLSVTSVTTTGAVSVGTTLAVTGTATLTGGVAGTLTPLALVDISGASAGQIKFPATQNASTNANTLDDYEEGTFTAALSFGGGTTGITYGAATTLGSTYVKVGKNVWVSGYLELTNKGSSTGAAKLTGLPFANEGSNRAALIGPFANFTGLTGVPQGYVDASAATVSLFQSAADTSATITDAAFTNTTFLFFQAFYRAAA